MEILLKRLGSSDLVSRRRKATLSQNQEQDFQILTSRLNNQSGVSTAIDTSAPYKVLERIETAKRKLLGEQGYLKSVRLMAKRLNTIRRSPRNSEKRQKEEVQFKVDQALKKDPYNEDYTVEVFSKPYYNDKGEYRETTEYHLIAGNNDHSNLVIAPIPKMTPQLAHRLSQSIKSPPKRPKSSISPNYMRPIVQISGDSMFKNMDFTNNSEQRSVSTGKQRPASSLRKIQIPISDRLSKHKAARTCLTGEALDKSPQPRKIKKLKRLRN